MKAERVVWWVILALLAGGVALALAGVTGWLLLPSYPEEGAFLIGLVGFWLMANRLLFGYGALLTTIDKALKGEALDRGFLESRTREPLERLKELAEVSLILMWLRELEHSRYTYYGLFFLLAMLTLLTKLNLLGEMVLGNYLEGTFWGASVITFLVWALEITARNGLGQLMVKEQT